MKKNIYLLSQAVKGYYAESIVNLKLLEKGFIVYPSVVDETGVDIVTCNPNGHYIELQVKSSWKEVSLPWFQVASKFDKSKLVSSRYFIVGVDFKKNLWIFPSKVFFDNAIETKPKMKSMRYVYDLNLDSKKRGIKQKRGELLKSYKNNWKLLNSFAA